MGYVRISRHLIQEERLEPEWRNCVAMILVKLPHEKTETSNISFCSKVQPLSVPVPVSVALSHFGYLVIANYRCWSVNQSVSLQPCSASVVLCTASFLLCVDTQRSKHTRYMNTVCPTVCLLHCQPIDTWYRQAPH